MKIAIIIPGEIDRNNIPYIKYFTDILDKKNIMYDFICWNRINSKSEKFHTKNVHCFHLYSPHSNNFFIKLYHFVLFSKFVKKTLKREKHDLLIIHTLIIAIFLSKILKDKYKNKFILDIRDYSPIVPYTHGVLKRIIESSNITTISSSGFLRWLPQSEKYILSHNIDKQLVMSYNYHYINLNLNKNHFKVLTIGHLRSYKTNVRLMKHLGNNNKFELIFAGDGLVEENLIKFHQRRRYSNVIFTGRYQKHNENMIVENADFLNILLPNNILENTLMSNRFYLSVFHNRPMLVNPESFQAKIVEKYNLGLIISNNNNIKEKIEEYIKNFNYELYKKGCNNFMRIIWDDIMNFENKVNYFIQKNIDACKKLN